MRTKPLAKTLEDKTVYGYDNINVYLIHNGVQYATGKNIAVTLAII